jgi:DNA-binding IclR family transcriptional regulator
LRIAETLCELGAVQRDASKQFRAVLMLAPLTGRSNWDQLLTETLKTLAETTGSTAEWYTPTEEGLVLVRRCAPPEAEVLVRAKLGFRRHWSGELEAVNCVALGLLHDREAEGQFWAYRADGGKEHLSAAAVRQRIQAATDRGWAEDKHYNTNGVRRMAAIVRRAGRPKSVLGLARHATPRERNTAAEAREALLTAATSLDFDEQGAL